MGQPKDDFLFAQRKFKRMKPIEVPELPANPILEFLSGFMGGDGVSGSVMDENHAAAIRANQMGQGAGIAANILPGLAALKGGAGALSALKAAALAGVIKPKGGNWVNNSVEGALRGLKRDVPKFDVNGNLTQQGGNYLGTMNPQLMRDYEAAFRASGQHSMNYANDFYPWLKEADPTLYARLAANDPPGTDINNWIDSQLTKYVKNRMATPDDEVRKLAERGVLHYDPIAYPIAAAADRRMAIPREFRRDTGDYQEQFEVLPGYDGPVAQLGQSDLAKRWEDVADRIPKLASYRDHTPFSTTPMNMEDALRKLGGDYAVANPEAQAYAFNRGHTTEDLGFNHLIDELRNAMNPASGLPRHLQLSEDAVKNMPMEKAVQRVHDINQWRQAQASEANMEAMRNATLIREYPHTPETPNPKGLRWVQLDKPGQFARESELMGHSVRGYEPPEAGGSLDYGLGGWPAIESGKAKVFSLQDAKGEPHATIEVGTQADGRFSGNDRSRELAQDVLDAADPNELKAFEANSEENFGWPMTAEDFLASWADDYGKYIDTNSAHEEGMALLHQISPNAAAAIEAQEREVAPFITQIKGKANRKPKDEYLPFVHDFVRNSPLGQPWRDVGDLHHTDLRSVRDVFNAAELKKIGEAGVQVPDWLSADDIASINKQVWPNRKYASGGSIQNANMQNRKIQTSADLSAIIAALS